MEGKDIQGRGNSLSKGMAPGKHMESVISPLEFFENIQNPSPSLLNLNIKV